MRYCVAHGHLYFKRIYMNTKYLKELEMLLDKLGTADILHYLGDICLEKAEHVRTNYQDESLAKEWELCRDAYDTLAVNIPLLP